MTFFNNLKGYKLILIASAQKELRRLDRQDSKAIEKKLELLISGAEGLDIKKLVEYGPSTYRLRVGNYRIIYETHEHIITILVIGIKHRQEAYKTKGK